MDYWWIFCFKRRIRRGIDKASYDAPTPPGGPLDRDTVESVSIDDVDEIRGRITREPISSSVEEPS